MADGLLVKLLIWLLLDFLILWVLTLVVAIPTLGLPPRVQQVICILVAVLLVIAELASMGLIPKVF